MARQGLPIDVSAHQSLVQLAQSAYSTDMSYAVAMAKQASLIKLKREVWRRKGEAKRQPLAE